MSRKGQSITLSVLERDKAELEVIARELGMLWGNRPNISKLVEAIARRQLLIAPNNKWTELRLKALTQATRALTDTGQVEAALAIANLLLERSELSIPLRGEIERFLENPPPPWRLKIDCCIRRQQPFQLSYQDAASRWWSFTDLIHNWSLRLDRITEAAVVPIEGKWRPGLDWIEVELHLFGGLAFAYQAKPEDVMNEWLEERERIRRVVRRISSTFWFSREVLRYAPDCAVVSPDSVRDRLKQKLISLCQQYNLEIRD